MDTFHVLTDPTPSLRERSRELEVDEILNDDFQKYLDKLIRTMRVEDGVGIASPQIGKNIRAIVVDLGRNTECYINPEITKTSKKMIDSEEGCLSVPEKYGIVKRHKKISMRALNRHGREVKMDLKNFPAIVFQHEIDHLDGILFIDKAEKIIENSSTRI